VKQEPTLKLLSIFLSQTWWRLLVSALHCISACTERPVICFEFNKVLCTEINYARNDWPEGSAECINLHA